MKLKHRYKRLGLWNKIGFWGSLASIVGTFITILLLMLPSCEEEGPEPQKVRYPLELMAGDFLLEAQTPHELVYNIRREIDSVEYMICFLPLFLTNRDSSKTIEDVTVSIKYAASMVERVLHDVDQFTRGEKATNQYTRRSEAYAGTISSYIHIDDIKAKQTFFLSEPFVIPLTALPDIGEISIGLSAKDLPPRSYTLHIFGKNEYDNQAFNKSIKAYYKSLGVTENPHFTMIIPDHLVVADSSDRLGLSSVAMKDKFGTLEYLMQD